jgi:predicted nucleotidyltransferase
MTSVSDPHPQTISRGPSAGVFSPDFRCLQGNLWTKDDLSCKIKQCPNKNEVKVIMYSEREIQNVVSFINNLIPDGCLEIILFGSYANKTSTQSSDLDIAIILNYDIPRNQKLSLLNSLWWETSQKGYSVDFIIKYVHDFENEKELPTLSQVIAREGQLLWKKN